MHAAGVWSIRKRLISIELDEGSSFVVLNRSELAIRDGGHCLHVSLETGYLRVKTVFAYSFLVGGSEWWFGTSVEDTVELSGCQGGLPVKPEAENFHVCLTNTRSRRTCRAHISTHRAAPHHRLRLNTDFTKKKQKNKKNGGIVPCFLSVSGCKCVSAALR